MKMILLIAIALAVVSCRQIPSQPTPQPGRIVAIVHDGTNPVAGVKLQLLETGQIKTTDENGMAIFEVAPGNYTVRAFNINRPGPALQSIDIPVETRSGETSNVEVFDCLACV
jgi:hypothetical protein